MKNLPPKGYSEELRAYVWRRHCAGAGAREIFDAVMEQWPDCGMKTFRSVCMMLGPLKVRYGAVKPNPIGRHKRAPRAVPLVAKADEPRPITLAGPSWSRGRP